MTAHPHLSGAAFLVGACLVMIAIFSVIGALGWGVTGILQ